MLRVKCVWTSGSTISEADLGFPVGPTNGEDKVPPNLHSAARAEGPQRLGKDVIPTWECTVRKRGETRGELKRERSEARNYMGKDWRNSARVISQRRVNLPWQDGVKQVLSCSETSWL